MFIGNYVNQSSGTPTSITVFRPSLVVQLILQRSNYSPTFPKIGSSDILAKEKKLKKRSFYIFDKNGISIVENGWSKPLLLHVPNTDFDLTISFWRPNYGNIRQECNCINRSTYIACRTDLRFYRNLTLATTCVRL